MSNYFVFTDEAGVYKQYPDEPHIKSHPFYIRANVIMSVDDYHKYQNDMQSIYGKCEIPYGEEIKWSDLWRKIKNNPRNDLIARMDINRLRGYYRKVLDSALDKKSTRFIFTVTDIVGETCHLKNETIYNFHLKNAFQRVNMEIQKNDFAVFIMDELNIETIKQIKSACHEFTLKGDFVDYKNLYQGVLTENSLYSPGIQLADYAAGIMNGYLRRMLLSPDNYEFANDLYNDYIYPRLRCDKKGKHVGFGIVPVPNDQHFRKQLEDIFDL